MPGRWTTILAATLLLAGPALADPPGRGKRESGTTISVSIDASDRTIIQDYFGDQFRSGRCPPGLAKKNNGCQPPGQAKKWSKGRRLPGDVVYHGLPSDLGIRLNVPAGSKYVRVGADILLIAVATGMVLDAIEDLGRQL